MKIKEFEINAVLEQLKTKQRKSRIEQKDEFLENVKQDGKFEELAQIILKNFVPRFKMFINLDERRLERTTVAELAVEMRREYVNSEFEPINLKRDASLKNEIVWAAEKCKTLEEIVNTINPFEENE